MLHDASGPTWSQTCYLPAAGAELEQSELAVTVLGRFTSRGGFDLNQTPRHVSFHVVHAGEGTLSAAGRSWLVRGGSVFTFVPGVPIHYEDRKDRPWRYTWCVLVGSRAAEIARRLGGCDGPWSRDDLPVAQALPVLDAMEAAFRSEDHSPYFAQSAAWRFTDALCPRGSDADRTAHLAIAIRRILEEQFALPLKLGSLAHQLGVDRSTVFRRFQSLYGCSPKAYLDRMRLEHAVALLRDGGLSVAEVARRCGYAGAQRFTKAFRTRYGVAPSLYRGDGAGPLQD
jgi:AraC-like DNA-binding protein